MNIVLPSKASCSKWSLRFATRSDEWAFGLLRLPAYGIATVMVGPLRVTVTWPVA